MKVSVVYISNVPQIRFTPSEAGRFSDIRFSFDY